METITQTHNTIRGQELDTMRAKLERDSKARVNMLLPVSNFAVNYDGRLVYRDENKAEHFANFNGWSLGQFTDYAQLPRQYFAEIINRRPDIAAQMTADRLGTRRAEVLKTGKHDGRLIRILDDKIQAVVSPSYFMIDAHQIVERLLPILDAYGFKVIACELTERRFYLKAVTERITGQVKTGDVVQYGVMISTSDVGGGRIKIEPFLLRLVCLNGAVSTNGYARNHITTRQEADSVRQLFPSDLLRREITLELDKLQEITVKALSPESFTIELEKMQRAAQLEIGAKVLPNDVVSSAVDLFGITSKEITKDIENNFVRGNEGAGLTLWGLANSFTAAAKSDKVNYDDAIELERNAGKLLELNDTQWKRLAQVH